jgi:HPt (histidine-containing phosphotransfer) domain-containing protein
MILPQMADAMGLTESELIELLCLFAETAQSDLAAIESAVSSGDALKASNAAHSLKGAAASLGLPEIHEEARLIEQAAREGKLAEARETLPSLARHVAEMARVFASQGANAGAGAIEDTQPENASSGDIRESRKK